MDYKKIKRGQMLYLVLQNRYCTGKPNVIVPVKVIRRDGLTSFIVEQDIEGFKHRLTVSHEWLTVLKPQAALDLAFNHTQTENRIHANSWRFSLTWKTARDEIVKRLLTLPKQKQDIFWKKAKKAYPGLFKNGRILTSKVKMTVWDDLAGYLLSLEFPRRDMEIHEG